MLAKHCFSPVPDVVGAALDGSDELGLALVRAGVVSAQTLKAKETNSTGSEECRDLVEVSSEGHRGLVGGKGTYRLANRFLLAATTALVATKFIEGALSIGSSSADDNTRPLQRGFDATTTMANDSSQYH